ncbi:hypothetical protein IAG44_14680 [Streptomyces roseirectus]|uniref:Uncharacterized protein n=1 Tax=Streptomyces roseirectus TaxID=2768066 RepID=A0A7H0ICP2_9ACTN|nr:hypothetical protein [Streptomyces roseirectus]QNP70558.1 hypothetical protein IAG44_14680 [Streptomyces roseirectus]
MHEEHEGYEGYEGNDPATAHPGGHRPRGRHRRPRPRKVFLAAGGLAFAAGVLGLLRIVPEPGGAGPVAGASLGDGGSTGTTGYGDGDGVTDRATNAAAAVPPASGEPGGPGTGSGADPGDTRSTSGGAASWGPDPRHTPSTSGVPRPTAPSQDLRVSPRPTPSTPDAPDAPHTPSTPGSPHTPGTPSTPRPAPTPTAVPPANHPAPPPRPTTPSPAPDTPDDPYEICVPAIGLCVDTPFTGP